MEPAGVTVGRASGFNAATTRRPWRTAAQPIGRDRYPELQCGHDPKAVENVRRYFSGRGRARASMRPRPEGRGEPVATQASPATREASMRPRPEGRGERHADGMRHVAGHWLQCGHDPKAVENRSRYKRLISRWLKRALRAGAGCDGKTKQKMLDLIQ